ncbi:hypothetical protein [Clostridium celatum]|uniref:Uncharacterized protein n=1 Tax=Clostridium celatum DSM 1785 TaxID=545697 RepID=L1QJ92_9CLOT|nr:hypothetical protein [Clostridium celatum]EKY28084.1 hypothetical protein HMPREF0216_00926 [Clostridium celatum DSM 1785]MCE9654153.1 hypothetical protein [Clostridium celatum]
MDDLLVIDDYTSIDLVNGSEILKSKFSNRYINIKENLLNEISEMVSGAGKIKDIINPEKAYMAKFPTDILEKMNSGQYDIMKCKDGELLSTIIDKTLPKNKNIVHQIRLEEVSIGVEEKLKDLSANISNMVLQQQLADLAQMLNQIQKTLIDVKRGQVLDRIALVKSGREKLEQAMKLSDSNEDKKQLIINAISGLNDGRAKLELYIRDEMEKDIKIPENKLILMFKSLFNNSYYDDIESNFAELEEGINAYFEATNLLAISYEVTNNREAIEEVFKPAKRLIQDSAYKMKALSKVVLNGEVSSLAWYDNEEKILSEIDNYSNLKLLQEKKYICIEFKGKDLLRGRANE